MRRAPVALLKRRAPCPPRRLPRRGVSVIRCNSCRTALPAGIQFAPKLCPEVSLRCHFAVISRLKAIRAPGESYGDVIIRVARGEGDMRSI
jgi:hypothetical protein